VTYEQDKVSAKTPFANPLILTATTVQVGEDGTEVEVSEVKIDILVDTHRLARLWTGDQASSGSEPPPFSWDQTGQYFPDGTPSFGIEYLPLFININDSANGIAETYVLAESSETLESNPPATMTVAFKSTGEFIGGRIRGFDLIVLDQFISDWTQTGDGTITFNNGEYDSTTGGVLQTRSVSGFQRLDIGQSGTLTVTEGTDTYTIYYKRVQR